MSVNTKRARIAPTAAARKWRDSVEFGRMSQQVDAAGISPAARAIVAAREIDGTGRDYSNFEASARAAARDMGMSAELLAGEITAERQAAKDARRARIESVTARPFLQAAPRRGEIHPTPRTDSAIYATLCAAYDALPKDAAAYAVATLSGVTIYRVAPAVSPEKLARAMARLDAARRASDAKTGAAMAAIAADPAARLNSDLTPVTLKRDLAKALDAAKLVDGRAARVATLAHLAGLPSAENLISLHHCSVSTGMSTARIGRLLTKLGAIESRHDVTPAKYRDRLRWNSGRAVQDLTGDKAAAAADKSRGIDDWAGAVTVARGRWTARISETVRREIEADSPAAKAELKRAQTAARVAKFRAERRAARDALMAANADSWSAESDR